MNYRDMILKLCQRCLSMLEISEEGNRKISLSATLIKLHVPLLLALRKGKDR